jgi:hypothetical protein
MRKSESGAGARALQNWQLLRKEPLEFFQRLTAEPFDKLFVDP